MNIPQKLTILDGAMAMDGGSISLIGKDPSGNIMEISLDWSLEAQINGTTKLNLNKMPLEKRSREEEKLLNALKNSEIQQLINGTLAENEIKKIAADRHRRFLEPFDVNTFYIDGRPENDFDMEGTVFQGIGTSPGKVSGCARIVKDPTRIQLTSGEIIVAENTDPGWTPILSTVNGLVIEEGGLLNHTLLWPANWVFQPLWALPGHPNHS